MAKHHLVPGRSITLAVAVGDPLVISMAGRGASLPHPITLILREGTGGTVGAKFLGALGGTYEDIPGLESVSAAMILFSSGFLIGITIGGGLVFLVFMKEILRQ